MTKRLFLFAGYNKNNIIDDALIYYVKALSQNGDVILCLDCKCPKSELNKISKYTLTTISERHGEYDFGSYKRAYQFANKQKILSKYDYIYLVNDSVYGPLTALKPLLNKLESFKTDVFGIVQSRHKIYAPIESWFIGMKSKISVSTWFNKFINSVTKQTSKENVTIAYENGFTDLLNKYNIPFKCLISIKGRAIYNHPKHLFKIGCPFIKKNCFIRHNGALGCQISNILSKTPAKAVILKSAKTEYTTKYISWLLVKNPIKCFWRNIKYILDKKL